VHEAKTPGPIEFRPIESLTPDPNNSRTHSDQQIEQIVRSIEAFGWTMPIAVDDVVRAGNARLAAAKRIYERGGSIWMAPGQAAGGQPVPPDHVPTLDCSGWTEAQRRAYALADNKLALNAGWDEDRLREELKALEEIEFDIDLTGFDMGEVTQLITAANEAVDPNQHWTGMPEFEQPDARAFRSLPVHFNSQEDLDRFCEVTGLKVTPQTRYLWYPEVPVERYADKRYVTEQ